MSQVQSELHAPSQYTRRLRRDRSDDSEGKSAPEPAMGAV
jgi:hypothetical protein